MDMRNEIMFCVGLVVVMVIISAIRKKYGKIGAYDERQMEVRLKASAMAYKAALALILANGFVYVFSGKKFSLMDPYNTAVLCICVSVLVFAAKCIENDAYIGLNINAKKYSMLLFAVGALNIVSSAADKNIISFVTNGVIMYISPQLMLGILFLLVAVMITTRKDKDGER